MSYAHEDMVAQDFRGRGTRIVGQLSLTAERPALSKRSGIIIYSHAGYVASARLKCTNLSTFCSKVSGSRPVAPSKGHRKGQKGCLIFSAALYVQLDNWFPSCAPVFKKKMWKGNSFHDLR